MYIVYSETAMGVGELETVINNIIGDVSSVKSTDKTNSCSLIIIM